METSGKMYGFAVSTRAFFFSGSVETKLDEKNRFVLPQAMRYGLIEEGILEFVVALGLGGSLAIYKKSDVEKIIERFRERQHAAKYQKFFTLFFSTLQHATCDKLGRVVLSPILKRAVGIKREIVIAGVLNRVEIWPKERFDRDLQAFLKGEQDNSSLSKVVEEAFALFSGEERKGERDFATLTDLEKAEYQDL